MLCILLSKIYLNITKKEQSIMNTTQLEKIIKRLIDIAFSNEKSNPALYRKILFSVYELDTYFTR